MFKSIDFDRFEFDCLRCGAAISVYAPNDVPIETICKSCGAIFKISPDKAVETEVLN